jgi:dimethylamine/trimethylamine dehydrogenase
VQNPTAGEEFRRGWHPRRLPALAADPGEILVVGAGPAGLEFAQTLAARGASRIRIVEAEAVPGGHLHWVSQLPRLADWWRIAEDRLRSIEQTDSVELLTDRRLDGPAVLDSGCSTVILATGSRWAPAPLDAVTHDEIPVPDRANVLTPDQLGRSGMPADWGSALVYDTYGDELAPAIAEWFAREGRTVHLLTPFPVVSPVADETMEGSLLRESLQSAGVRTLTGVTLSAVTGDGLRVSSEGGEREIAADGVVLISHRLSNLELSSDLEARRSDWREAGVERILSVGDCVAPRTLADAVFDGHRLAREFEEPDPEYAKAMRVEWRRSRGSAVEAG